MQVSNIWCETNSSIPMDKADKPFQNESTAFIKAGDNLKYFGNNIGSIMLGHKIKDNWMREREGERLFINRQNHHVHYVLGDEM